MLEERSGCVSECGVSMPVRLCFRKEKRNADGQNPSHIPKELAMQRKEFNKSMLCVENIASSDASILTLEVQKLSFVFRKQFPILYKAKHAGEMLVLVKNPSIHSQLV